VTALRDDEPTAARGLGDDSAGVGEQRVDARPWWYSWALPLAAVVVYFLAAYIWPHYVALVPNRAQIVLHEGFAPHYAILVLHIVSGTVALATVCLQLWPWLRRRYPAAHRVSGRAYVFAGVIPSSVLIYVLLPLTWGSNGYLGDLLWTTLWFSSVLWVSLWLTTTILGFRAARQCRYTQHRRWMIRSFALGIAILWTRPTFNVAFTVAGLGDLGALQTIQTVIGWVPWIFTLGIAELWLYWTARRPVALAV
jgi:hypothetical protein